MGRRNAEMAAGQNSCADWTPPPELQMQWQALPQVQRMPDRQTLLANIIENDVIPRLLLANRNELAIAPPAADLTAAKLRERVDEFSELVINSDAKASIAYFEALQQQGASLESMFQDLLAPTARRLGELWDEDINDFLDVTRGIGHLQQIVRTFSDEFSNEIRRPLASKRALLMPLPDEQHTFGISLLREHFLREGWRVWSGPPQSMDDIVKLVKGQYFEMLGLSASALKNAGQLAEQIRLIRKASINRNLHVFVGGYAFIDKPELVAAVGADATAADGREALLHVKSLIEVRKGAG